MVDMKPTETRNAAQINLNSVSHEMCSTPRSEVRPQHGPASCDPRKHETTRADERLMQCRAAQQIWEGGTGGASSRNTLHDVLGFAHALRMTRSVSSGLRLYLSTYVLRHALMPTVGSSGHDCSSELTVETYS